VDSARINMKEKTCLYSSGFIFRKGVLRAIGFPVKIY